MEQLKELGKFGETHTLVVTSEDALIVAASRLPYFLDRDAYLLVEYDNCMTYIAKIHETAFSFTSSGIRPKFVEFVCLAPIKYWAISNSAQAISNKVTERQFLKQAYYGSNSNNSKKDNNPVGNEQPNRD